MTSGVIVAATELAAVDPQKRPPYMCPECGHNMYQQGRTWTCENCGYSYIE